MIQALFVVLVSVEPQPPASLVPPAALKQKYDDVVKHRKQLRKVPVSAPAAAYRDVAKEVTARVERVEDSFLLVSMRINRAQRRWLIRQGIPKVSTIDQVAGEAIMRHRHFKRLRMHQQLLSNSHRVDDIQRLQGQRVRMKLVRSDGDAHLEVRWLSSLHGQKEQR